MPPDLTPGLRLWAASRRATLARQDAVDTQRRTLRALLRRGAASAFGAAHGFAAIRDVADYQRRVPLRDWQAFWAEWWGPAFPRVGGTTWPTPIREFAKTSGSTATAAKHIPVSAAMTRSNRGAARDLLAFHLAACPGSRILGGQNCFLGGTTALDALAPGIVAGDLSGLVAKRVPWWGRGRVFPPADIALMTDWRAKMARMAEQAPALPIVSISGTASWLLLFFEQAMAQHGGKRLADLFPRLELVVHGGVGFAPYRDRFATLLDGTGALTREAYAASEGFLACADRGDGEGLRLILDRGLFFEFVRPAELGGANPDRRWIGDAELGVEYAVVLSSNAGLWGYVLGDTVRLVSRDPPRVLITGRTAWMLSVAGEHISGAELDSAMARAAAQQGRGVVDFSAAPIQPDATEARGGHLFAVELDGAADALAFGRAVDAMLVAGNEDYAAHRSAGFGLRDPDVRLLPPGSFARWMAGRGKLGGQNKVPRVVADVAALAGLLAMPDAAPPGSPAPGSPNPPGSGSG